VTAALRKICALVCILASATLAGCGEDDAAPREAAPKTTTAPTTTAATTAEREDDADSGPSDPTSTEDREQIAAVLGTMEAAINAGDADRLCSEVYAFSGNTTKQDCVKVFGPALKQSQTRAKITLRGVRRTGDKATVSVSNSGLSGGGSSRQTFRFSKEEGQWRVPFG